MFRFGFICLIFYSLLLVFVEAVKKNTSPTVSSNSLMFKYSTNFSKEKQNDIVKEYVRELNVSQRWKNMETTFIKILSAMYNGSMPFISQINKNLDISTTCKRDLMKMFTGIKEFKYWAVQMLDSFGKIPTGIERGTFNAFGDFDQCLDVVVPDHFQGQYCNLELILPMPKRRPYVMSHAAVPELMNAIKPDGYFTFIGKLVPFSYFVNPRVSICVPSTCSKEELQKIANKAVETMELSFGIQIPNCEVLNNEVKFDRSEIGIITVLGVLVFTVLTATAVDVNLSTMSKEEENGQNYTSLPIKYLLCFSLYANAKRLFKPDTENDSIKIFHGMRVLTTIWVIMVHSSFYHSFGASGTLMSLFKHLPKLPFQGLANGFINVQTFFFMSGTLHALRTMKMKEKINVKKHILRRIWRLAPAFMLVIGCVILLPHVSSGPVWNETMEGMLANKCRKTWWTNFLFINNFIPNKDLCLQWLWYIPVDFQLYVFSLLVLIPMKKNPQLGLTINFLLMIGAMAISAAFHVYYNLTPMLVLAFAHPEDTSYFLERGYFRTYLHCSSVCIGLAVGCFLVNSPRKLRISWKISVPLWLTSSSVCVAIVLGVYRWNQGYIPNIAISALYASGSKILWALSLAWLTIACMTGNGGIVTKFLSLPIFVPLGRLCYMVYLIHSVIHYVYLGSSRLYIRIDFITLAYMFFATLTLSFFFAFVLTLFFESPFMALDKLIFSEKLSERTKKSKTLGREKPEVDTLKNGDVVNDMNNEKKVKSEPETLKNEDVYKVMKNEKKMA